MTRRLSRLRRKTMVLIKRWSYKRGLRLMIERSSKGIASSGPCSKNDLCTLSWQLGQSWLHIYIYLNTLSVTIKTVKYLWVQLNIRVSKIKERVKQGLSTSIRARSLGGCHSGHMTGSWNTVKTRDWEPAFSKVCLKRLLHKIHCNLHKLRLVRLFNTFLFCDRFEPRSHLT